MYIYNNFLIKVKFRYFEIKWDCFLLIFFIIDFDYFCRLVIVGLINFNMKFVNFEDENMLDVLGFDVRVLKVIRTFVLGEY